MVWDIAEHNSKGQIEILQYGFDIYVVFYLAFVSVIWLGSRQSRWWKWFRVEDQYKS